MPCTELLPSPVHSVHSVVLSAMMEAGLEPANATHAVTPGSSRLKLNPALTRGAAAASSSCAQLLLLHHAQPCSGSATNTKHHPAVQPVAVVVQSEGAAAAWILPHMDVFAPSPFDPTTWEGKAVRLCWGLRPHCDCSLDLPRVSESRVPPIIVCISPLVAVQLSLQVLQVPEALQVVQPQHLGAWWCAAQISLPGCWDVKPQQAHHQFAPQAELPPTL